MSTEKDLLRACEPYEEWIALAVGGDLDERRSIELARHLDGCPRCRRFTADMEETRDALRHSLVPPEEEAVFARIRAGVHREVLETGRVLPFRRRAWRRVVPALAVAATLAAAVGLYRLERPLPVVAPAVAPKVEPEVAAAPPSEAVTAAPAKVPSSAPVAVVEAPAVLPAAVKPSETWLGTGAPSPGTRWLGGGRAEVEAVWLGGEPASEGVAWLDPPAPETPQKIYQDDQVVLYWMADSADDPKEKDDAQPTIL